MLTLESMPNRPCHWLMGEGPKNDILISSRVRLARNLLAFPFMSKATETQREEIQTTLRSRLEKLKEAPGHLYVEMSDTQDIDRQMLMERHLISRQLAAPDGSKGVFITEGEDISVMVNEEDHLRIQAIAPGLQIQECWQKAATHQSGCPAIDKMKTGLNGCTSARVEKITDCRGKVSAG